MLPRTTTKPKLSAVIACYRDALAIPDMHERLTKTFRSLGVDYEIIFVNDASPDDAREVLDELTGRDDHVIAIHHTRNFGSQSAFTSGMRVATGDAVILLDGDLQDPPEVIADFYAKWRAGWDVVYGIREQRIATRVMQVAYKAFYRVFRAASYIPIPLDAGDFSLIDRRAVEALNSLPESGRFIRGLRAWVGFKQTGVPYVRPERLYGTSTNSLIRNLAWARRGVLSFSYAPLDVIVWLAFFTVAFSMAAIVGQVILKIVEPSLAPKGFASLFVVILFVGGVQLLCLGIVGSYIAHIYEEVKHRPAFIVESITNRPGRGAVTDDPEVRRCLDELAIAIARHGPPDADADLQARE